MQKLSYITLIGSVSLILFSCNKSAEMSADMASAEPAVAEVALDESLQLSGDADQKMSTPYVLETPQQKKIVKTGSMSIETANVGRSKQSLDALVRKFEGHYEQESLSKGNTISSYNLIIRIPSSKYDSFIAELDKGNDKITSKSIQSQDLTAQYYDLDSRIKSKRAYLQRYTELLAKARSVKEVLEIEEQIRVIQEEIDATQASLKALSNQVDYSTLTVYLYQEQSNISIGTDSFGSKFVDALRFGWAALETFFIVLIRIWPFLLLAGLGVLAVKKYRDRKRRAKRV